MSGKFAKRVFDLVVAVSGLLLCFPVLAVIAALIKLESPRDSIFYRGRRIGQNAMPFRIWKFRTMVPGADHIGGPSTSDDDRRVTRTGRFLRKWKLDELPQLLNVMTGEMSLVGPRPEVPEYVELFHEEEKAILTVLPGMTDWASLWNRDEGAMLAGSADPERTYLETIRPTKIQLQLDYVRHHSFFIDLEILCRTFASVLFRSLDMKLVAPRLSTRINEKTSE